MVAIFANLAASTLAASIDNSQTSIAITSGDEGFFPSPSGGDWFPVAVVDAAGNVEFMACTARSGVTLTVARAQEGTAALAFDAGARVSLRLTAAALAEKADADTMATALGLKADANAVATALGLKADASALALKADATELALKADKATTYTKTEVDGKTTIASEAEAQGFTDNTKLLTPLRGLQLATAYNRWKTIRLIDLAGISVVNETDLSAFAKLRLEGEYIHAAAGETGQLIMRLSTDNGSNYAASGYNRQAVGLSGATGSALENLAQTAFFVGFIGGNTAAQTFVHQLNGFNKVGIKRMIGGNGITYNSGSDAFYNLSQRMDNKSYAAANAIRFLTNTSTIASGLLHIEGIEG